MIALEVIYNGKKIALAGADRKGMISVQVCAQCLNRKNLFLFLISRSQPHERSTPRLRICGFPRGRRAGADFFQELRDIAPTIAIHDPFERAEWAYRGCFFRHVVTCVLP